MHDIEPYHLWRDFYVANEDRRSPFYGKENDLFVFRNQIYNYIIHPEWDEIGSPTLYMKLLFADYDQQSAIFELIGEWNDCIQNDIMYLKRNIADRLISKGISKFVLVCENVLNFHGGDDCYYEEWNEDVTDQYGWIALLNIRPHVEEEMRTTRLHHFLQMGDRYNDCNWRKYSPANLVRLVGRMVEGAPLQLPH